MKRRLLGAAAVLSVAALPFIGYAADHIDAPAAAADPAADITDVYAWMNEDADRLQLIMNVYPMAGENASFSDAVQYVMHVNSSSAYGADQTETLVICQFYAANGIECWAGDEYVYGDPTDTDGLVSESGNLRVFAGRRDDPFFFELTGFQEAVKLAVAAAPSLMFDDEGCPEINAATSELLVTQLQSGADSAEGSNTFAGASVLSLAIELEKSVVDEGGPILAVWGSTHAVTSE
jgi:hypothetical protein